MGHLFLTVIIPFLIPFVVFFCGFVRVPVGLLRITVRFPIEKGNLYSCSDRFGVCHGVLAFMALWGPEGQPGTLCCPRIVDGEIVPGRFGHECNTDILAPRVGPVL